MARNVTIACVSSAPLALEPGLAPGAAVDAMIAHWRDRLDTVLPDRPDLVVLPEQCDRPAGAAYPPERQQEFFDHRGDLVLEFLAGVAKQHDAVVAYSGYRRDTAGVAYNSTRLLAADGSVLGTYDKNFLTIDEHDRSGLAYGAELGVFESRIGRIVPIICFDLNFDELRAAAAAARPDLIVFSSAYHGGLMQGYWAYSCGAYLATAVYPPAPSGIVSPVGETVATTTNYRHEVVSTVNLDRAVVHIDYNGAKFAAIKRRYGPAVRIHDPGRLGSVLVSAEAADLSIEQVIGEFDLELLPDYLARARAHRTASVSGSEG